MNSILTLTNSQSINYKSADKSLQRCFLFLKMIFLWHRRYGSLRVDCNIPSQAPPCLSTSHQSWPTIQWGRIGWRIRERELEIAKLRLNSQLNLHFNSIQSPLQVNSTPPRVELELCLIFGFHHPPPPTILLFSTREPSKWTPSTQIKR